MLCGQSLLFGSALAFFVAFPLRVRRLRRLTALDGAAPWRVRWWQMASCFLSLQSCEKYELISAFCSIVLLVNGGGGILELRYWHIDRNIDALIDSGLPFVFHYLFLSSAPRGMLRGQIIREQV